jgi:hypothetical protein
MPLLAMALVVLSPSVNTSNNSIPPPAPAPTIATTVSFITGIERRSVFARKSKHVKLYLALGPLHHHGTPGTVRR